jgi:predicted HicB family RNase H-like nuclease
VHAEIGLYTGNVVRVPSLAEETPYRISLIRTGDGASAAWLAEVEGLPGCSARGATPEEAVQRAWAAAAETTSAAGPEAAPEQAPKSAPRHSGKLLVRMPATLHDELAQAAEREGVSLNQLITGVLASAVAWRSDDERGPGARPIVAPAGDEAGSRRLTRVALAANLAVVSIAAAVAIALLIVAWRAGF